MVMSGGSINQTTLFLDDFGPSKWLSSTKCTHFRLKLKTAVPDSAEGETNNSVRYLSVFLHKNYVVAYRENRLSETVLISGLNLFFIRNKK